MNLKPLNREPSSPQKVAKKKTTHTSVLPDSFISSSEATFTLMSWLSRLLLASMGLPSLRGLLGPVGPSWARLNEGPRGGLRGSSAWGSSFTLNEPFSASFWLAAAGLARERGRERKKSALNHLSSHNNTYIHREKNEEARNRIFCMWWFIAKAIAISVTVHAFEAQGEGVVVGRGRGLFIYFPSDASGAEFV